MEAFGLYLLKSAIWLSGFTIVFLVFLRNERYFELNRAYLLSGIFASIVFPFYTWHYAVILPSLPVAEISIPEITDQQFVTAPVAAASPGIPVYWWLYILGIAYFSLRLIWQTVRVIGKLRKSGYVKNGLVKLVRTPEYSASFSFFSFVFVNPSTSDIEMEEIVNHESGHIQKRHWFDLLLVELLRMLQWFNPFAWIYAHLVRQNHEYMADEMALKRTSNPAIYQATLLNQMLGVPVISLANSFSYSLNKQRFKMMKKKINSPFRKLRMLMVLPLIAMVFYAFAKPEYRYAENENPKEVAIEVKVDADNLSVSSENSKTAVASKKSDAKETTQKEQGTVKGKVTKEDGNPLQGATIVVRGTTTGTVTDADGNFKLINVSKNAELNISYVGMDSKIMKPDFDHPMNVKLDIVTIGIGKVTVNADQSSVNKPETIYHLGGDEENPPMYILDGRIIDKSEVLKIKPDDIYSISVLKDKSADETFGEKAKNGVVIISSKKNVSASGAKNVNDLNDLAQKTKSESQKEMKSAFQVVEQMPQFPGGARRLMYFLSASIKYPAQAKADKVEGTVAVNFLVSSTGKIEKVKVIKNVNPELDAEAVRVISLMPDWNPGKQNGKPVEVYYTIPMEFSLKSADVKSQDTGKAENQKGDIVVVGYGVQKKKPDGPNQFIPPSTVQEEKPFVVVEQMPQFPGGENVMREFIKKELKYPENAMKMGIEGVVIVNFVIGSDGKLSRIKVVHKIGSGCDAEAVRILNLMPNWIPGKQGGKAVAVSYTVPIKFSLNSSTEKSGVNLDNIPPPPPPVTKDEKPFVVVEQLPQSMMKFIKSNIKYPENAKMMGIEGVVIVNFFVDEQGKIRNPKIMSGPEALKDEAFRVINLISDWIPEKQGDKPVNRQYTLPVTFELK